MDASEIPLGLLLAALFTSVLIHGVLTLHPKGWMAYPDRWIPGSIIFFACFASGQSLCRVSDERLASDHICHSDDKQLVAEVISSKKQKKGGTRLLVDVIAGRDDSSCFLSRSGKMFVYLNPEDSSFVPAVSSRVLLTGSVKRINPPDIPGQFDFSKWAAMKQVHCQMKPTSFFLLESSKRSFSSMASRCRQWISDRLALAGLQGETLALVTALLVGDDDGISPELFEAFSATGTLHILSVSGMHVAMVYAAIRFFLSRLPSRWRRSFVPWLSILLIWTYAFITGFSPAVQRAATTLTLFILSGPLRRPADSWNLLSASLLLVLISNPLLSQDAGLQLSYLAVAGILLLSKWLTLLFTPHDCSCRVRFRRYCSCDLLGLIGQAAGVSIAAQLFTFPLGLYQFHSFPLYFLPANLIVVPLSSLLIYGALVALPFAGVGFPGTFIGVILNSISLVVTHVEYFMGKWPGARIDGIGISGIECLLIYAALFFFTFYLVRANTNALNWMLVMLVLQIGVRISTNFIGDIESRTIVWADEWNKSVTVINHDYSLTVSDYRRNSDSSWMYKKLPDCLDECKVPVKNRFLFFRKPDQPINIR